jgi:predicted transcriptional regulator
MVKLRDIMTAPVVTFDPDISIREAAEVLVAEGVGGAPVMLHGELLGMVSASDLLDFMSSLPAEPDEVRDRTAGSSTTTPWRRRCRGPRCGRRPPTSRSRSPRTS